jgi:tripartite-type tricarboxylate transporter receptor subunit TctC
MIRSPYVSMRRSFLTALAASAAAVATGTARAQSTFPNKPVRLIVPVPPGGAADNALRLVAKPLSEAFGQNFLIDNKPGGEGVIAARELIRSAPDGHSLMFGAATQMIYTPLVRASNPPYDPLADFVPVSLFSSFTYFVHVHESVPVKTMQEFVAFVKANPGKVAYGTGDATSIMAMAQFQMHSGAQMVHIPYKGGGDAFADFVTGRIQVMIGPIDLDTRMQGKSRPVVVLQAKRSPLRPDIPTFSEVGLPQVNLMAWTGIFAPAKTPVAVVERVSQEMIKVFRRPELIEAFARLGMNLEGSAPEALGAIVRSQLPIWKELIQFAKVKVE